VFQVITVEVRIDSRGQSLPPRDILLPKVKALRKALQNAHVCKKVGFPIKNSSGICIY
jgi:hypothetical protein